MNVLSSFEGCRIGVRHDGKGLSFRNAATLSSRSVLIRDLVLLVYLVLSLSRGFSFAGKDHQDTGLLTDSRG